MKCEVCGSCINAVRTCMVTTVVERSASCCCAPLTNGVAAVKQFRTRKTIIEDGTLDDENQIEWSGDKDEEVVDEETEMLEVNCQSCLNQADENDWTEDYVESEVEPNSHEVSYFCEECERELQGR